MEDIKEKVICPWCKEEMRPYPHQGYYWFQCKCGARSPTLWHATEERARENALSYTADVVPKSEYDNLKSQFEALDHECDRLERAESNRHDAIEQAKTEVARGIFAEIDDFIIASGIFEGYYGYPVIAWNEKGYEELKNKYTEDHHDSN